MPNESELMPWHKTYLTDIEYNRVDLVKEGANSKAHIKLFKSKGGNTMPVVEDILKLMKPEHAEVITKALEAKDAEVLAAVEKAKKDATDAAAATTAEDAIDGGSDDSIEKILKSVQDPAVRLLLETQINKAKAAESVAKELKDKQNEQDAIAKAKEVPNLGAEEIALASVYKKLHDVDSALCDEVFGIMKAASALIGQGNAFVEIGKGAGNAPDGLSGDEATIWGQIEAKAEEIAKGKNIKKSAAIAQAVQENPELYTQYLKAQNA